MKASVKDLSILAVLVVTISLSIWLPHLLALKNFWGLDFSQGFSAIYRNFDGLEYVIVAKSLYNPELIATLPQSLPASYFPSHFPGYSLLINVFAPLVGYLKSMLFVTITSTILAVWAFYILVRDFKLTSNPLFLSFIFLILPARWVIVHSVGSSEPLFIFLTTFSVYLFMKYEVTRNFQYLLFTAVFASLAQLTRPPGILLFIALMLFIHFRMFTQIRLQGIVKPFLSRLKYFPLILIPFTLLGVFFLYQQSLGDFWAYFKSGDNIHLTFPPFQVFNKHQFWVGEIWLEELIYIFILGFLGAIYLWRRGLYPMSYFVLTYLFASTLIAHRDISRYILPITPFLLISFEKVLVSREFKIILPIILLAIYLYSQNFLIENTAPVPNPMLFN